MYICSMRSEGVGFVAGCLGSLAVGMEHLLSQQEFDDFKAGNLRTAGAGRFIQLVSCGHTRVALHTHNDGAPCAVLDRLPRQSASLTLK
jgi:hypothetical protein